MATIIYLLALQKRTRCPIRLVDEVNQGMDEKNERRAFFAIMRSCGGFDADVTVESGKGKNKSNNSGKRKHGSMSSPVVSSTGASQFFLLTPKLLPDLPYNGNVTVHVVFNGPYMMPDAKWDMRSFRKRARRLSLADGRDENEGKGLTNKKQKGKGKRDR